MYVAEYGDEAIYNEPSQAYILKNVICHSCQVVQDIDLFRSSWLESDSLVCMNCGSLYDLVIYPFFNP
jgi:hypothetical protein